MLDVLSQTPANHCDIVYSSYALCNNGCMIAVGVMHDESQTHTVRKQWEALTPDERNQVQKHIRNCDFPEPASMLEELARNAGFTKCRRLEKQNWLGAWCYEA